MIPKCKKEFFLVDRKESTDFNTFIKSGYYQCNFQNGTNAPNIYATGMLIVTASYYISQLYIAEFNNDTVVYARMSHDKGRTWLGWKQLA